MTDAPKDPNPNDDQPSVPDEDDALRDEDWDTASATSDTDVAATYADEAPQQPTAAKPRTSVKKPSKTGKSRASAKVKLGRSGPSKPRSGKANASKKTLSPDAAMSRAVVVVVTLAVGVAGGWLLGTSQANAAHLAEVAPAGSASAGVPTQCKNWSETICTETSETSAACSQAKAAADLLPAGACNVALKQVPATIEHVKAARAVCTQLVTKLCKDLGETTKTCEMVKTKTESFPPDRCREMLGRYDQVIGELRQLEQRGRMAPHGMPPGATAPGAAPPGAGPH